MDLIINLLAFDKTNNSLIIEIIETLNYLLHYDFILLPFLNNPVHSNIHFSLTSTSPSKKSYKESSSKTNKKSSKHGLSKQRDSYDDKSKNKEPINEKEEGKEKKDKSSSRKLMKKVNFINIIKYTISSHLIC